MIETPCRDVPLHEWAAALSAARSEGFDFFDWLTAVDETDAAESPGFDLVRSRATGETMSGVFSGTSSRTSVQPLP